MPQDHNATPTNSGSTERRLMALDDTDAFALLATVARAHEHGQPAPATPEADETLREALAALTADPVDVSHAASDGDAARAALALLAHDQRFAGPIEQLLTHRRPERMEIDLVTGTVLVTGLLLALQTHGLIERDKDGRWSIKFEKKPTKDGLLTPIISKLLGRFGL